MENSNYNGVEIQYIKSGLSGRSEKQVFKNGLPQNSSYNVEYILKAAKKIILITKIDDYRVILSRFIEDQNSVSLITINNIVKKYIKYEASQTRYRLKPI